MAQEHDLGAEKTGGFILSQIRKSDSAYKQVFSSSILRIGDWGWPRPDFVCYDDENKVTYALEYKPPMQSKREYVCGLGQSITYLQHHTYSGLIVPEVADDGFPIAEYFRDILVSDVMHTTPISLYSYNPNTFDVQILKAIENVRTGVKVKASQQVSKTFWCWWRDMSHFEVYDLLRLSFLYSSEGGDTYTNHIFPDFWNKLTTGKTFDFEGNARKVEASKTKELLDKDGNPILDENGCPITKIVTSYGSYKQNYRIPFEQLGLWTSKEGKLSELGYRLLEIGNKYGPDSANFKNAIAYLLLTVGHHLDLIHIISDIQDSYVMTDTSMEFKQLLDIELTERGLIGKRKPTAVKTDSKGSYVRDELKLWNKFGLLQCKNNRYFDKDKGLTFNWQKITEVLTNGKQW